jgi:hypothetical protein
MARTTSMPLVTLPNTTCLPSNQGVYTRTHTYIHTQIHELCSPTAVQLQKSSIKRAHSLTHSLTSTVVTKNWLPLELGPLLAMDSRPVIRYRHALHEEDEQSMQPHTVTHSLTHSLTHLHQCDEGRNSRPKT